MKKDTEKLLQAIYKNANMGIVSLTSLRDKITDNVLQNEINNQIIAYEDYKQKSENYLRSNDGQVKELSAVSKMMSESSIKLNTMVNSNKAHISSMVIDGTIMGTKEISDALNECSDADPRVITLASDLLNFEKNSISEMKDFL